MIDDCLNYSSFPGKSQIIFRRDSRRFFLHNFQKISPFFPSTEKTCDQRTSGKENESRKRTKRKRELKVKEDIKNI